MSFDLEKLANSLFNNQVPDLWRSKAYPSLKPLSAWVNDLEARLEFFNNWINNGTPAVYWMSGFFFPQAFLTGVLQTFARKNKIPVDTVSFDFEVLNVSWQDITTGPEDGCYIRGLYLEGASWDSTNGRLAESRPKELFSEMPGMCNCFHPCSVRTVIHLKPVANRQKPLTGYYDCPVYKTLARAGTLSTTGHSTNFVLSIELPSNETQKHWIKRGVALICSLNY